MQSQIAAQIAQLQNQFSGQGNPYSQLMQLALQHHQDRLQTANSLAAHGIVDSGDLGYRFGQSDHAYGQALYGAQQQLLQQIGQLQQSGLTNAQQLHGQVVSALQNAYTNFANNPQLYTGATPPSANQPTTAPAAPHRAVARHLTNPYVTGQKLYG